ncbi:MAG: hypothetical protein FJY53_01180 [Betaproteobacteria bacterium]|nr:hypothetical protein [Betaproteobacteria bacterium]
MMMSWLKLRQKTSVSVNVSCWSTSASELLRNNLLRSTNMQERLNEEIRRREQVFAKTTADDGKVIAING